MPAIIDSLPPELTDEILNLISTDMDALRSLALTSRSFLSPCQSRIFSSATVNTRCEHDRNTSQAQKLLAVLNGSPRDLAGYITHFTVQLDHSPLFSSDNGVPTERSKDGHDLIELLLLLSKLTRFSLKLRDQYSWCVQVLSSSVIEAIVASLRLSSIVQVDFKNVPIGMIHACSPSVKHMALWDPINVHWRPLRHEQTQMVHQQHTPPIYLNSLFLDSSSRAHYEVGETIKQILQSGLDLSQLRKLVLNVPYCRLEPREETLQLLRACSASLEDFSFCPAVESYADARTKPDNMNLGFLTSLRVLHLSVRAGFVPDRAEVVDPIVWITDLLDKIPQSNRIEWIIISSSYYVSPTVNGGGFFGIEFDSYVHLAGILTKGRFPHLRKVTFHTDTRCNDELTPKQLGWFVTWIERCLKHKMVGPAKEFVFEFSSGLFFRNNLFPQIGSW
ncbi:hypothetical protein GALMADRAFT_445240 [Galerina marginata CBS 339.88]|uniref:F-box domain-containing protein n=1 Tax=Galerina marginata (strain CBS 339.88) TaxID=685588 RepID=A0A067T2C6_GALM3|nr:hypothetical protein GALMADRAFT_445240 [Galerina marginata CBS 339.88]